MNYGLMIGYLPYFIIVAMGFILCSGFRDKEISLAEGLGLSIGVETAILLGLGYLGFLSPFPLISINVFILLALLLWARVRIPELPRASFEKWLLVVMVFVLISFYSAAVPRKGFDAYKYHLYYGKITAIDGGLPSWGEVHDHHWFFPQMYELLLASTWVLEPDSYIPAYMLNAFLGLVCSLAIYELVIWMKGGRERALFAVLIFYATPIFFTHTTNGYNDILLGVFTLLGFLSLTKGNFDVCGVIFGLSAWVKVFGLLNIAFLLVYMIWRRRPELLKGLGLAILIGSVFFARNIVVFGDPLSVYSAENTGISVSSLARSFSSERIRDNLGWWFLDYSDNEEYISLTHRGIGVLLPMFLVYALLFCQKTGLRKSLLLLALIWCILMVTYCNLGGEGNPKQITRYSLPGLVPLCALAGVGMGNFLEDPKRTFTKRFRYSLLAICILYPSLSYAAIPGLDSIVFKNSIMPGEDLYLREEYPEVTGIWTKLPEEPYSVKVAWIGLEVTPYVLRQRRAEWPNMWFVGLEGIFAADADYYILPTHIEVPSGIELEFVYSTERFRLWRAAHNENG